MKSGEISTRTIAPSDRPQKSLSGKRKQAEIYTPLTKQMAQGSIAPRNNTTSPARSEGKNIPQTDDEQRKQTPQPMEVDERAKRKMEGETSMAENSGTKVKNQGTRTPPEITAQPLREVWGGNRRAGITIGRRR